MGLITYYHKEFKPTAENLLTPSMKALASIGVKPNHITAMQFPLSILMFWFLINKNISSAGLVLLFVLILDGLDGQLARITKQETRFGHVLDKTADIFCILLMLAGIALCSPQSFNFCTSLGVVNLFLFITNEVKGPFFYTAARDAGFLGLQGISLFQSTWFLNFWLFVSLSIGTFLFIKKSKMILSDLLDKSA